MRQEGSIQIQQAEERFLCSFSSLGEHEKPVHAVVETMLFQELLHGTLKCSTWEMFLSGCMQKWKRFLGRQLYKGKHLKRKGSEKQHLNFG